MKFVVALSMACQDLAIQSRFGSFFWQLFGLRLAELMAIVISDSDSEKTCPTSIVRGTKRLLDDNDKGPDPCDRPLDDNDQDSVPGDRPLDDIDQDPDPGDIDCEPNVIDALAQQEELEAKGSIWPPLYPHSVVQAWKKANVPVPVRDKVAPPVHLPVKPPFQIPSTPVKDAPFPKMPWQELGISREEWCKKRL